MKLVRFKEPYAEKTNGRLSYELVMEGEFIGYDEVEQKMCMCYAVKLLGDVSVEKMEEAEPNDIPAINVFVKLSQL